MGTIIKGYKVTDKDMKCRGFQYELNKEFTTEKEISLCKHGFHFCLIAAHCFKYYDFDSKNRVFEVIAGEKTTHGDYKSVTNKITLIRELSWQEVLSIVNTGNSNTGYSNTGDRNTGNWNTGNSNTGDWNTGNWNTGNSNTGNWNTGNSNTGYSNTGNRNTGYSNTGDRNTGNWNTGNWNTGYRNTGYSNTGDRNTGAFCTGEKYMKFFNKESKWTEEKWLNSPAYNLMLNNVDTKIWVPLSQMSDEEKSEYPSCTTSEGYLKDIPFKEAFKNAWHNWSEENRSAFTSLPNFDAKIFFKITGVKL